MTKSEKQSWEQERAKGRDRFLLRHGLLRFGLPFGILMTLGKVLFAVFSHHPVAPIWELFIWFGAYTLILGCVMGLWNWQNNERDYTKPTEDDDVV